MNYNIYLRKINNKKIKPFIRPKPEIHFTSKNSNRENCVSKEIKNLNVVDKETDKE